MTQAKHKLRLLTLAHVGVKNKPCEFYHHKPVGIITQQTFRFVKGLQRFKCTTNEVVS